MHRSTVTKNHSTLEESITQYHCFSGIQPPTSSLEIIWHMMHGLKVERALEMFQM